MTAQSFGTHLLHTGRRIKLGNPQLNSYGDHGRLLPSNLGYGTDISFDRLDELDLKAIADVRALAAARFPHDRPTGLDIGCGYGRPAVEFACAGADVIAIDLEDTGSVMQELLRERAAVQNAAPCGTVRFLRRDVRQMDFSQVHDKPIAFVYSQRFLHYIRFSVARKMFSDLRKVMEPKGRVYIGVSGLGSELGEGYAHADRPIAKRFCRLDLANVHVSKHQILQPVCLYTKDELADLFISAGYSIDNVYESEFGNIKGIFIA